MDAQFDGKNILVTGASRGIGCDIAKALVKAGAKVYAVARNISKLEELKKEFPSVEIVSVDLADWNATRTALQRLPPIHLLVSNAGIYKNTAFLDVGPEEFDRAMDINVKAFINVSQIVAKQMIERGEGGAIVALSSLAAKLPTLPGVLTYGASKAALDYCMRTMARELGPHKIRVNCVNPTVVKDTDMGKQCLAANDGRPDHIVLPRTPLGDFPLTSDVVSPVLYLLSDEAKMITGVTLMVDGGFMA